MCMSYVNGPIHVCMRMCIEKKKEEREKKDIDMILAGKCFLKKNCWGLESTPL